MIGACQGGSDSGQGGSGGSDGGGSGGSGIAGGPSEGMLELVSTYPDLGTKNASAHEPIVLTFSANLDETTVKNAVGVEMLGETVAFETFVDGKVLRVVPREKSVPGTLSVTLDSTLRGAKGETFVGDSLSFGYRVWADATHGLSQPSSLGTIFSKAGDVLLAQASAGKLEILRLENGKWVTEVAASNSADSIAILAAGEDETGVWVATHETKGSTTSVFLRRADGDSFVTVGGQALRSGMQMKAAAARADNGEPIVATALGTSIVAHGLASDGIVDSTPFTAASAPAELAVADLGDFEPKVAFTDSVMDISVVSFGAGAPALLGSKIDRSLTTAGAELDLGYDEDALVLLYRDGDKRSDGKGSHHYYLKRYESSFVEIGKAIDIEVENDVKGGRLVATPDGELSVGWFERNGGSANYYLAEIESDGILPRLVPPVRGVPWAGVAGSVALDGDARGFLAYVADQKVGIFLENSRNVTVSTATGAAGGGGCAFDEANPPATLSATGCYADVGAKKWVAGFRPYALNSILWSDGATKRRGILLPKGKTAEFASTESFSVPVGTIVVKEFWIEKTKGDPSTSFIVETRFLVKRCEEGGCTYPWTGYSYQWNAGGTNASLMPEAPDETRVEFDVTEGGVAKKHTHIYPGRLACLTCHNETAGRLLGVSAPQFDRHFDDGEFVENQLHAWARRELFGTSVTTSDPTHPELETERLPSPPDVGYSLTERTLAYFQSNCAHCHRPEGLQATIDFRYFGAGPVASGNICDVISPGDHTADGSMGSLAKGGIYARDSVRTANKMPPLATDVPDDRQLAVTAAWIDSLSSCP